MFFILPGCRKRSYSSNQMAGATNHLRYVRLDIYGGTLMSQNDLEKALAHVSRDRRGILKTLLIGTGTAIAAVPLMTTQSMAQKAGEDPGPDGKCDDGLVVGKKSGKCQVPKKKAPAPTPSP
jgi:hypothetical protein